MTDDPCPAFVLVVDDDTDLRETLIEVLQEKKYRALGASNGKEALDLIHRGEAPPCVILLDLMMPIMDGKTFYVELRKEPELSRIPVIVLSAQSNMQAVLADVAIEAKLSKPVSIEPLLALVKRHCGAPRAQVAI